MTDRQDGPPAPYCRSQLLTLEELYSKSTDVGGRGLYAFLTKAPPHWVYIGRSTDLGARVRAEKRLKQHFSHVLVFTRPGEALALATLKEMEKRALRTADIRWPWARWRNKMDLFVQGTDPYRGQGSQEMEGVVGQFISDVERFMSAQPMFDPRVPNRLPPTHVLGDCLGDLHAFGRETETGRFVVYADSRLTSAWSTVKELMWDWGPYAQRAAELYHRGLITRLFRTYTRRPGLCFVRDHEFPSSIEAAELLMGRPCENDPWRLATPAEVDRFFVIEGTHRRW